MIVIVLFLNFFPCSKASHIKTFKSDFLPSDFMISKNDFDCNELWGSKSSPKKSTLKEKRKKPLTLDLFLPEEEI